MNNLRDVRDAVLIAFLGTLCGGLAQFALNRLEDAHKERRRRVKRARKQSEKRARSTSNA